MKRLYFLLPSVDVTRKVVDELREAGISDKHMYTLAKAGTALDDLPEATIREKTDLLHGLEIGAAGGVIIGLLAGLVAVVNPPSGVILGGGAIAARAGIASLSAILGALIGLELPNVRLRRFENAIEAGQILMLVDVPTNEAHDIESAVIRHHPEVTVEETQRTLSDLL